MFFFRLTLLFLMLSLIFFSPLQGDAKIIGGKDADPSEYPWMVSLINPDIYPENYCGGVLISSKWLVTAAHCLHDSLCGSTFDLNKIKVLAGTHDLKYSGVKVAVTNIIIHPDYDCMTEDSDIGLLKLETDVNLPPVRPASSNIPVGMEAVAMGWGIIGFETRSDLPGWKKPLYSDILQELSLNTLANNECEKVYPGWITDNMICAVSEDDGKAPCFFDSGGPLIVKQNGNWVLAGILSWGADEGCAIPGKPDVFTRVSEFRDFIYEHIGYPDMPYDYNDDQRIGLEDAVYVIRSIAVENSDRDISDAIKILQVTAGVR
ncbi:MAG: serine protease [Desulfobacterales bacterium]|nr:serine protease [Desulfobacterales bacterium]